MSLTAAPFCLPRSLRGSTADCGGCSRGLVRGSAGGAVPGDSASMPPPLRVPRCSGAAVRLAGGSGTSGWSAGRSPLPLSPLWIPLPLLLLLASATAPAAADGMYGHVASGPEPYRHGSSTGFKTIKGTHVVPSWLWDPSSKNYSWPNVHSYCIPCKKLNVGTCFLGGCYDWRGPTDCVLTRCVCKKGYCAKEDAPAGLEKCEPQVCVGGPRPFPARRGFSVSFFYWMLGERPFPTDLDTSNAAIWHFGFLALLHGLWVPVLGCMSISVTMWGFHYYRAPQVKRRHRSKGGSDSPTGWRGLRGWRMWMCPDEERESRDRCRQPRKIFRERPRIRNLLVVCALSVVICYLGVYIRERNWTGVVDHTRSALKRFEHNADVLKTEGSMVARTCVELNETLQEINWKCSDDPLMDMLSGAASSAFEKYIHYVDELNAFLGKLPGIADLVASEIDKRERSFLYFPLLPVVTVAILIVILVSEVLVITTYGKLKWALRLNVTFQYSTWLFGSIIMFVTLFVFAGFVVAMMLGSFCYDVDENILSMVENYVQDKNSSQEIYTFTKYYLTGTGVMNPAMVYTKKARLYIDEILDVYLQFEGIVKGLYVSCEPLQDIRVRQIAKEARQVLQAVVNLLEPANIYPYYEEVVRQCVCQEVMHSLASFPVFTLLLGMVIFPICMVNVHRHLVHWAFWKHQQRLNLKTVNQTDLAMVWSSSHSDDDDGADSPGSVVSGKAGHDDDCL